MPYEKPFLIKPYILNNPIQVMLDEHDIISSAEQIVKLLDRYWEKSESKYVNQVHSLIIFFREYADKYHHFKEEQILFPELEKLDDFAVNSIVSELIEHHEMFREHTTSIEEFLDDKQYESAQKLLFTYMDELLDHIAAENDEVFVMAESLFSENELESMYFKFKDIDMELGESNKEKLCEKLNSIEMVLK